MKQSTSAREYFTIFLRQETSLATFKEAVTTHARYYIKQIRKENAKY